MTLQQELSKKRQEALAKENAEPEPISPLKSTATYIIENNLTPIFRTLQASESTSPVLEVQIYVSENSFSINRAFPYCKKLLKQWYFYPSYSTTYSKEIWNIEVWNEIWKKAPAHGFILNNNKPEYCNPYGYMVYTATMYLD